MRVPTGVLGRDQEDLGAWVGTGEWGVLAGVTGEMMESWGQGWGSLPGSWVGIRGDLGTWVGIRGDLGTWRPPSPPQRPCWAHWGDDGESWG